MSDTEKIIASISARCPGGSIPNDYLVIDLETSGFRRTPGENGEKPDVVVQVGYAAVRDRKIVSKGAHYLKRPPGTMKGEALEVTGITDQMLHDLGEEPVDFYPRFLRLLRLYRDSHCMFVGHNIVGFDGPFLTAEFERMGIDFAFKESEFIDTGCIFKAAQMGSLIGPHETLDSYFRRIRYTRNSVKWRLEFAAREYGIDTKHNLNLEEAHDAGFDCLMTHHLLEALRESILQ